MIKIKKNLFIVSAVSFVFMLAGCGKDFVVNHYPAFYQPEIKEIAILPFDNKTSHKGVGRAVAEILAADLAANQTYKVTGPSRLARRLKDKGITLEPDTDFSTAAQKLGALNEFQAFVTGRILSESFQNVSMPINDYVGDYGGGYDFDEDFYDFDMYYPYYYFPQYYDYETDVYLSVNASMVAVPGGNMLDSTLETATADVSDVDKPLRQYGAQVAMNDLCGKLVKKFAVVPVTITVHPGKDLKTADSFQQGKWHFTGTFSRDDDSMYVILCLPAAAARNQFKLTILSDGSKTEPVVQKDITWQPDGYCQSFKFSPREIAAAGGPGSYNVQFHSRDRIVMTRNFKIK